MTEAAQLIDALNTTFGRHKDYRASHAKGIAVAGRFVPALADPAANIPLLHAEQPVVARFSIGGGKPGISDKSPTVRGIGLTIGSGPDLWTLALISAPVFFANSAQQFVDFLAARVPDPKTGAPNPEKVKAFNIANPNTLPHQEYLKSTSPCRCYSTERFHSAHAYRFSVADNLVAARVLLEPATGRVGLTEDERAGLPDDFLGHALQTTLEAGPASWTLKLVIANAGDERSDPTAPWTGENQELSLGTIRIEEIDSREGSLSRVFDPAHLPQMVGAPEDLVFPLRSSACAESKARRSG